MASEGNTVIFLDKSLANSFYLFNQKRPLRNDTSICMNRTLFLIEMNRMKVKKIEKNRTKHSKILT